MNHPSDLMARQGARAPLRRALAGLALPGSLPAAGLALFPNPAYGTATLTGTQPVTVMKVYDALGRPVTSATADAGGTATLVLPAGRPAGVYPVRAGTHSLRLTVE